MSIEISYNKGKPTCGVYDGMVFSLSFNRNAAGKGKGAWIGETMSGFHIVHSGNYIIAVFPPNNDKPEIFEMNTKKQKIVNGIKSGVLRV